MCSYNLEYKEYSSNISDGLRSLYSTLDIADITLAVEGKLFKAHQVILSIFSPYFREIFCQSASKQTVIFMKGVKHKIMRDLLIFMYEGKVEIHEDDFNLFVETARELKIKGLSNEQEGSQIQTVPVQTLQGNSSINEEQSMKRQLTSPARDAEEERKRCRGQNDSTQAMPSVSSAVHNLPSQHNLTQHSLAQQHNLPQVSASNNLPQSVQNMPPVVQNSMYLNQMQSQIVASMQPQINTTMAPPMLMPSTSWMQMPVMPDHTITPEINIKLEKRDDGQNKLEIGPTEVHYDNAKDDSMELYEIDDNDGHDVEDHFMAADVELHEGGRNVKLETNHSLIPMQPKIAEGEPVTVTFCTSKKTRKTNAIILDGVRYQLSYATEDGDGTTWRCGSAFYRYKCRALARITKENKRIVLVNQHNHPKLILRHRHDASYSFGVFYVCYEKSAVQ